MPTPIVKLDGSTIYVEEDFATGKQYVDAPTRLDMIGRHYCRFEDYGLANNMWRCRKCGLIQPLIIYTHGGSTGPIVPREDARGD
jgi:hypothetical protein